jgi:hypothetical protein
MKAHQEKTEAPMHSVQSKLEETIKHQVENILACIDQRMQGMCKELNKKIDEMEMDLQVARRASIHGQRASRKL